MNTISKDKFLFMLNAIVREVTFMSESRFGEIFIDGKMTFDRFSFQNPSKTTTTITMKTTEIQEESHE